MQINIINGSPKMGESTSGLLISYLLPELKEQSVEVFNINKAPLSESQISKIQGSDVLVFAFPLYIDSIPSHLLRQLVKLEQVGFNERPVRVYCIVNNGFYEGKQDHIAIEQMKLWCQSAHLIWGQGMGIGAGEMLPIVKNVPLGYGPNKNLGIAIKELANNILNEKSGEDKLISVNYPRFLWRIQSSLLFWLPRAKKNGLKRFQLYKRL